MDEKLIPAVFITPQERKRIGSRFNSKVHENGEFLSAFLGEIGRHQLLTPEQELMLGRRFKRWLASPSDASWLEGKDPPVSTAMKRKE